jgi:hypothetical protein
MTQILIGNYDLGEEPDALMNCVAIRSHFEPGFIGNFDIIRCKIRIDGMRLPYED